MRNDEWTDVFSYGPWGFNPAKCFSCVLPTERGGMMPRYEIVGNDGDVLQLYNIWGEQFLWLSTETLRRRAGQFTLNPTITVWGEDKPKMTGTYSNIHTYTYKQYCIFEHTTELDLEKTQHLALFLVCTRQKHGRMFRVVLPEGAPGNLGPGAGSKIFCCCAGGKEE